VGVNKATNKLYPIANTPEAIVCPGVDGLKKYIKTIGRLNSKAENVNKTCSPRLIDRHETKYRKTREELEACPVCLPQNRQIGAEHRLRSNRHGP